MVYPIEWVRRAGLLFLLSGALVVMSACSSNSSPAVKDPVPTPKTLASIAVTPANPSITQGQTKQFTATGTYSDSSTQDITMAATWNSSATSVATISSSGLATSVGAGTTTVQATMGSVSGTTKLTVTATPPTLTSIAVTPTSPTITQGQTEQFTATGTYSDSSTQNITSSVTWSSSAASVATISSGGLATSVGAGSTTIQATMGGISGTTKLTVTAAPPTLTSIAVTPASPTITQGQTEQFTATGTYSNSSTQNITGSVTWSSSATSVATISSGGLATSVGAGSTTIQATMGSVSGTTKLTVTAIPPTLTSIAVTPANPTITQGLTQQFTATGTYSDSSTQNITGSVTWNSSATGVATISNTPGSNGLATSVGGGSTTIQATLGTVSGSTKLTVTASSVTLIRLVVSPQYPSITEGGTTQPFTAIGHYSDGSTQDLTSSATWTSTNTNVAAVNASGTATSGTLGSSQTAGFASIEATVGGVTGVSILTVTSAIGFGGVFMHHNDISRTGQNLNETTLTTANVNSSTFGKLFSYPVDGQVYAQPLYVPNVTIGGAVHNVVYVATEGDSVYAFDADSNTGANANPLWHATLIDTAHGAAAGATTVNVTSALNDSSCTDIIPQVGITSTPTIDPSAGTMYVEAKSQEGTNYIHRLHAIDITTGNEKAPGPVTISGSVPGTGDGSVNGTLTFDALHHLNRPGLLLLNGVIYLAYASHCDDGPFHGWLFAYDAQTFTQQAVYVTTPNGGLGGFWMSGAGIAADSAGNIFIATGNGDFAGAPAPLTESGDTILKLNLGSSSFSVVDYFTPYNQASLGSAGGSPDVDLGSGGVLLLPDQPGTYPHVLVAGGKQGTIYVVNRDQMTTNNSHYCSGCSSDTEIIEESAPAFDDMFGMPAYWNNTLYYWSGGGELLAVPVINGLPNFNSATSPGLYLNFPGALPSISSNGTTAGTAILWAIDSSLNGTAPNTSPGPSVVYAYDASDVAKEGKPGLWNSSQAANNRDQAGNAVKFTVPTVANGKVYIGTQTELDVYGLLP